MILRKKNQKGRSSLRGYLLAATLWVSGSFNLAQAATPADAFQQAEYLGQIVERLLESDLLEAKLIPDPDLSGSRPRHVLRLAVNAYENVQFIRSMNGLSMEEAPKTRPEEVKPDDVVAVLEAAVKAALALGPIYEVDLSFDKPARADKKTPDDVLARLRAVNDGLEKLGKPQPLPNDVYRIALGIKEQAKTLTKLKGLAVTAEAERTFVATPADALESVVAFIKDLDSLSVQKPDYLLAGGVVFPPVPKKGEAIKPAAVLLASQYALADIYSLSVKLGHDKDLVMPPVQSGRNPADVKNMISEARLHIRALAESN